MKNRIIGNLIFYFSLLLPGLAVCQKNPGYLGKKNCVSISSSVFPYSYLNYALVNNFRLNPTLGLTYERSIFRNFSFEFGYQSFSIKEKDYYYNYGPLFSQTSSYYHYSKSGNDILPATILGSGKSRHRNLNFTFKNYFQRRGAIAPYGRFVALTTQISSWKHINPDYSTSYIDGLDTFIDKSSPQPGPQKMINLGLYIGKKSIIIKNFTFEWSFGIKINIVSSVAPSLAVEYDGSPYYTNQSHFINAAIDKNIRSKNAMEFKFQMGYLF